MKFGKPQVAILTSLFVVAAAIPAAALAQATAPPAQAPSASTQAPAPVAPPALKPYEEVIKLWKGNLSEDFIKRRIESSGTVYELSADDMIACKAANLPESIIEAMMATATKRAPATGAAAALVAAPAAAAATGHAVPGQVPAASPPVNLAAMADRTWEGVVRRNDGVVLFKSRWDDGKLSFKDQKLAWFDADEEKKNLIITGKGVKEQFLVCLKGSSADPECFEWGVKTGDGEYRFRDVAWERSDSTKPREIFEFFKAIYPTLVSATYPADKK